MKEQIEAYCVYGRASSVRYSDNSKRMKKSKEELQKVEKNKNYVDLVIKYTNEYLKSQGMEAIKDPRLKLIDGEFIGREKPYEKNKEKYQLEDQRDLVWMKFTTEGILGVVACSNDINVYIPNNEEDYKSKTKSKWKYNTSGIIIHRLGKSWNKEEVLVFPLPNIPKDKKRSDIEHGIGDYLIEKGVPILDFYSHRMFKKRIIK